MRYLILLAVFLYGSLLAAQQTDKWQVGASAGLTSVPYLILSGKTSSGVYLGGFLRRTSPNGNTLDFSLDYGKTSNLRLQALDRTIFIFPEETVEINSIISLHAISEVRLGVRLEPSLTVLRRIRFSVGAYGSLLTGADIRSLETKPDFEYEFALTDEERRVPGPQTGGAPANISAPETERGNLFAGWSVGMSYNLKTGPQVTASFHSDLTDRFNTFRGTSDARLYQFRLGFRAPVTQIFNGKQAK